MLKRPGCPPQVPSAWFPQTLDSITSKSPCLVHHPSPSAAVVPSQPPSTPSQPSPSIPFSCCRRPHLPHNSRSVLPPLFIHCAPLFLSFICKIYISASSSGPTSILVARGLAVAGYLDRRFQVNGRIKACNLALKSPGREAHGIAQGTTVLAPRSAVWV